jgi:hypothetical protein
MCFFQRVFRFLSEGFYVSIWLFLSFGFFLGFVRIPLRGFSGFRFFRAFGFQLYPWVKNETQSSFRVSVVSVGEK